MKLNFIKTIIAITSVSTFAFSSDEFNIWEEARKTGYFETSAEQKDEEFQSISKLFPSEASILGASLAMTIGTGNNFETVRTEQTREAFSTLEKTSNGDITIQFRLEVLEDKYHSSNTASFLAMFYNSWGDARQNEIYINLSIERKVAEKNKEQEELISVTEALKEEFGREKTLPFAQEMKHLYPEEYYTQNWMQ